MKFTALDEDELENNLMTKGKNSINGVATYLDPVYLP